MIKRKLNVKRVIIAIILLILIIVCFGVSLFFYMLSPINKVKKDTEYEITSGLTPYEVFKDLKDKGFIRNDLITKVYIKLTEEPEFKAGTYVINDSMSTIEIIEKLSSNDYKSGEEISLTFKEGYEMVDLFKIISENTSITEEEIKNKLKDETYLKKLIDEYWFITDDILDKDIYYSLEGYLFPNTYNINPEGTIEEVFKVMLKETDKVLSKFKSEIEESEYSIHEILTMASIIEKEAILDKDRALVSSVFYNRLDANMAFQSCATLGYAIGEWKLTYTKSDMATDSPYNTYKYPGFPPGPGNNAGEKSIEAAIKPETSSYYYFMADVCSENPETYFSKTYNEHVRKVNKYLTCF